MVPLAQGDLPGAQHIVRDAWSRVDSTRLAVIFGASWDLYWVLDDAQQRYLLSLPERAFGVRGAWAECMAETYAMREDHSRASAYADSARQAFEATLRALPEDMQSRAELGLVLGYMGRKTEAIREGESAVAALPIARDAYSGPYLMHLLARTYALVGEPDKAIDALSQVLRVPYWLTPAAVRLDPAFASLRANARFQALLGSN
jgi:tetratricopeptide (TPR) repeat protein